MHQQPPAPPRAPMTVSKSSQVSAASGRAESHAAEAFYRIVDR
jgi:hypothetical protein